MKRGYKVVIGEPIVDYSTDERGRPALIFKSMDVLFMVLADDSEGQASRNDILHAIAKKLRDELLPVNPIDEQIL